MPPKPPKSATRSNASKPKLRQNKLDFSHSTSSTSRPFGSRPLSHTPSFSLPGTNSSLSPSPQPDVHPPAFPSDLDLKGKGKANGSALSHTDEDDEEDPHMQLWSERLAPCSVEDLAIHPKKVNDVSKWLSEALSNDSNQSKLRKMLTLTGPAGSGKSTVIRALSSPSELDYDILEWQNDTDHFDPDTIQPGSSFIDRFTNFLCRAAMFPRLNLQAAPGSPSSSQDLHPSSKRRRIILLEDLPNIHHLPTKQLFHEAIEQFFRSSSMRSARELQNVPIVLIVTESTPREDQDRWALDASTSRWKERMASIMDARTALNDTIRRNPAYTEIRFNPVAHTIMIKGLKRAMEAQSSISGSAPLKPPSDLLQAIAENASGDIRAAVNCLQFVCAKSEHIEALQSSLSKRKRNSSSSARSDAIRRLMPLVSGRESSLLLFHAIGRVLYNKRAGDPGGEEDDAKDLLKADRRARSRTEDDEAVLTADDQMIKARLSAAMRAITAPPDQENDSADRLPLPSHLADFERRHSRVDVDQLWADLPVDSSMFQLYLHQNLPQFTTDIEQCERILEDISLADSLVPLHEQYRHSSVTSYYSFLITVRATLLGLPSPVPRNGQKLGKATYWEVQKKTRQMMDVIGDVRSWLSSTDSRIDVAAKLANGDTNATNWAEPRLKRTRFNNAPDALWTMNEGVDEDLTAGRGDAGLGEEARSWLMKCDTLSIAIEVLPLLAKIQPSNAPQGLSQIARMRFEYAGVSDLADRMLEEHDKGVDDGSDGEVEGVAIRDTNKKSELGTRPHQTNSASEEKMYISEDDIDDF